MVHFYYFIHAGKVLDKTASFYKVAVGSSRQCQRDFLFLVQFSVNNQCYFELVTEKSRNFLERVAGSLCVSKQQNPMQELPLQDVKIRDLVRHLKSGTHAAVPLSTLLNKGHARSFLDINYRVFKNLAKRDSHMPSERRNKPEV